MGQVGAEAAMGLRGVLEATGMGGYGWLTREGGQDLLRTEGKDGTSWLSLFLALMIFPRDGGGL